MYWFQPTPKLESEKPTSWECWTDIPRPASEIGLKVPEQIGYVDLMYTTIGMRKYIASFNMSKHPEQQEIGIYVPTVKKGKQFVEENYMAWRMIGTLNDKANS